MALGDKQSLVPDYRGLALVGDADAGWFFTVALDRAFDRAQGGLPDLLRVVLHPAGLRKVLLKFGIATRKDLA